uniref:Large ribosomal subunit protein uL23c n=2 Tax=Ostreobium TaxID=121087 RepID=A0A1A8GYL3_9CHLO|nr:ribosomal protein L23 [Ostreobium sp. OS1B]SBQ76946.2 Ribosomal protein L23 [Ostreobium quekettii]
MSVLIKYPVLTEKSTKLIEKNQYTFFVDTKLNKKQIKSILESLYEINIISVNTHHPPKRRKRFSQFEGYKTNYKKVIIKIPYSQSISILPKS